MKRLLAALLSLLSILTSYSMGQVQVALSGQIIVDSKNPSWLVYNQDKDDDGFLDPFFMCGPGDPEGFLYRGTLNEDGTRNGDQLELIDKLKQNGGNCLYLITVRTHGGDAMKDHQVNPRIYPDSKHNPWIEQNPTKGLNQKIMDQWERWFEVMDEHNIVIYLFIYDDAIKVSKQFNWHLDESGDLHSEEKKFIQSIVNRFEHHKNLIWCVMEEAQEIGDKWHQRISKIAQAIREADDYNHVIASHQLGGNVFHHKNDANIDQFSIQARTDLTATADDLHHWLVQGWKKAEGQYNLNISEDAAMRQLIADGDHEGLRKRIWAAAMSGCYVMVLGMNVDDTPMEQLRNCRTLQRFFESTNINVMAPHDELALDGTQYILALPGYRYIAYSSVAEDDLGIKNMPAGEYETIWLDCIHGTIQVEDNVALAQGDHKFRKPKDMGQEAAMYVKRIDVPLPDVRAAVSSTTKLNTPAKANIAPVTKNKEVVTEQNKDVYVQLLYDDPDGGPGPYETIIVKPPSHGTLSGVGNDLTYTPNKDYTGQDSFEWKVNDGEDDSNIATVVIDINKIILSTQSTSLQNMWIFANEAENYHDATKNGWVLDSNVAGYSCSGYMKTTNRRDGSKLHYNVDFPSSGIYYLYIRSYATNHKDNGVHLEVNGKQIRDGIYVVKQRNWNWASQWKRSEGIHDGPVDFKIDNAGINTISLKAREANFKADKFIITNQKISPPGKYSGTTIIKNLDTTLDMLFDQFVNIVP